MSTTDRLTIIGVALATVIAIVTMVNGNVNARVGDLRADMDARISDLSADMDARINDLAADLRDFRTEVNRRMDGFDARLRAVEIAFAKIEQRLATLERAIIPAAQPAE